MDRAEAEVVVAIYTLALSVGLSGVAVFLAVVHGFGMIESQLKRLNTFFWGTEETESSE